jgi:DNA-binding NarL/FixJ family response regulator
MKIAHQNIKRSLVNNLPYSKSAEQQNFIHQLLLFLEIEKEGIPQILSYIEGFKEVQKFKISNRSKFELLTNKEREVFKLVVEGKKSNEIADELYIETTTVSTHRKRIKQKLNVVSIFDWYNYAKAFDFI